MQERSRPPQRKVQPTIRTTCEQEIRGRSLAALEIDLPSESIDVDPDDADNPAGRCTSCRVRIRKPDVQRNVQHGCRLKHGADLYVPVRARFVRKNDGDTHQKRSPSSNAIHDIGDIDDGSSQLDQPIYAGGQQRQGARLYPDHLENFWRKVVQTVGASEFVE